MLRLTLNVPCHPGFSTLALKRFFAWSALWMCATLLFAPWTLAHDGDKPHSHASEGAAANSQTNAMTTREGAKVIAPSKPEDGFHFAIYGDRTGGVPEGLKVLEQAVVDTNLLDPDIVMTVGDLIQGYNETPEWLRQMEEYQAIMNRLNMRWFPVAGNHDVYWRGAGPAPEGQHESNYEKHFGPLWYSFQHKNAGFVVLYSDEGDPESNRKGFNEGKLQTMSDAQLAFLEKALQEHEGLDHVFVFLHHPRWIGGGYSGGNWDKVHELLVSAGNVSAVFAGHIHHMRYDGPQDGIEYYTLATTGGSLSGDIPDAGFLHHLNLVSVRKDRISVSALPIGSVIDPRDFTPEFLQQVELARTVRPVQTSDDLVLQADGTVGGSVAFKLTNPCPSPIDVTLMLDPQAASDGWLTTLGHQHVTLAAGESRAYDFSVRRASGSNDEFVMPNLIADLDYLSESARIRLPQVTAPIGLQLGEVPANYFAETPAKCLWVDGPKAALRVDSDAIRMADGPMTLEAWVRPLSLAGFNGMIAKTQSSEYAFFSDEGVPQFDLHVGGNYVSAKADAPLSLDRWTHLAGVFDGSEVRLFVDGKQVAETPASGSRRFNDLPLFVGADPDGRGQPTRAFNGKFDEVRLSSAVVYEQGFTPERRLSVTDDTVLLLHLDKQLGPFTLDQSSRAAKATLGPDAKLVPVE